MSSVIIHDNIYTLLDEDTGCKVIENNFMETEYESYQEIYTTGPTETFSENPFNKYIPKNKNQPKINKKRSRYD